jgi:hypothetical protein
MIDEVHKVRQIARLEISCALLVEVARVDWQVLKALLLGWLTDP